MTRSITKYIYFHSKINKESIGDTQNLVELLFQAILFVFQPYIAHSLAWFNRSRWKGSLILFLTSIQGAIVTKSIIKCIYSNCKLNKESDGGNYIFVH